MKPIIGPSGLVIFDGSCGICSAYIGEKRVFFEKYGFSVAPLQEEWVRELTKLNEESLMSAIHLYTSNGSILKGIDFFEYLSNKIWWLYPIALLLKINFLKPLFASLYNSIANQRRKLSKLCGLEKRAIYK